MRAGDPPAAGRCLRDHPVNGRRAIGHRSLACATEVGPSRCRAIQERQRRNGLRQMPDPGPLLAGARSDGPPTIRVLEPAPGVLAFYAGRDGSRFAAEPNWVDEGAISLGIASYALVAGDNAIVYDTGISLAWGEFVLAELRRRGVARIRVVVSHHHLDHIAGTQAFDGCEVISNQRTAVLLAHHRVAIEAGELEGPPAISPLVLPTRTFTDRESLQVGHGTDAVSVELFALNIHSDDATVLWIPAQRLLLAGDTMEDTATFVDEPHQFNAHLRDLARLRALDPLRILPNHGSPDLIAAGGYPPALIDATEEYIRYLRDTDVRAAPRSLHDVLTTLPSGRALRYFPAYESIHRHNLHVVADARSDSSTPN